MTNEFSIIDTLFKPLAGPSALGLEDDAALLSLEASNPLAAAYGAESAEGWYAQGGPPPGMVITTDTLVAGVHFHMTDPAEDTGWKVLAVSVSDLAAKGVQPRGYTLNVSWPRGFFTDTRTTDGPASDARMGAAWARGFVRGLEACQRRYGFELSGGDTTVTDGPLVISATLFGLESYSGAMIRRSGAQAGDIIWVSGHLGEAALGLYGVEGRAVASTAQIQRYLRPQPRLELGLMLAPYATAAADVSDGLLSDVGHIARASGLTACIEQDKLPHTPEMAIILTQNPDYLPLLYSHGDDYEIVFTAKPDHTQAILALIQTLDLPLSAVGCMKEAQESPVILMNGAGQALDVAVSGFMHDI